MTRSETLARIQKLYRRHWPSIRMFEDGQTYQEIAALPDDRLAAFLADTERQAARLRGADLGEAVREAAGVYADAR